MKNIPYEYFYLGLALSSFTNISVFNWEFYAITIPFTILEITRNFKK